MRSSSPVLGCHFEWFSIENCIEKCFEVLSLIEFSIEIPLFSKAKFTRTDIFWIKNSQLKINNYFNSPLTSQDYSLFIIRYFLFLIRYSPLTTHISLRFNRVLDTNFTFFKSKIHSNWHSFNVASIQLTPKSESLSHQFTSVIPTEKFFLLWRGIFPIRCKAIAAMQNLFKWCNLLLKL